MIYCILSIVPVCTRYCHGVPSPSPHTLHPDSGQVLHQTGPLPGLNVAQTKLTSTRLSRLSRIIYLKKYLKRRKLLLKKVFCSSTNILLNTATLHFWYISHRKYMCTHFIRSNMQTSFETDNKSYAYK